MPGSVHVVDSAGSVEILTLCLPGYSSIIQYFVEYLSIDGIEYRKCTRAMISSSPPNQTPFILLISGVLPGNENEMMCLSLSPHLVQTVHDINEEIGLVHSVNPSILI